MAQGKVIESDTRRGSCEMSAIQKNTMTQSKPTIPNIFHFIYVGGRQFSFIHLLAVLTAWKVNRPELIYFHHTEEPTGLWWEKARPMLTLHEIEPINEIYGNPIKYPAHMADVIRMQMLQRFGGVYLDLDVICINPLKPLMDREFVMGMEPGTGLCNAVILSRPGAEFLTRWQSHYRSFKSDLWNHHSVVLPWQLARTYPETIHVANQYAFFYPTHNDPVHRYLWGMQPDWYDVALRLTKNILRLVTTTLSSQRDAIKLTFYRTFHALRSAPWHYEKLRKSYCLHLWEGLWGEPYLKAVTPEFLKADGSHFAKLMREILSEEEIKGLCTSTINS
jgi:hypothetical protein